MDKALRYVDEKSDKFWRVETLGVDLVCNWGKTGSNGRYQIFEFETSEECIKKAEQLISQKKKKGYKDFNDFDKQNHLYFDDEEIGGHLLTSHPVFRKYFCDKLYFDCVDEEAPFGSDEGADTYSFLEECVRKNKNINFTDFPRLQIEDDWELLYIPPSDLQSDDDLVNQAKGEISGLSGDQEILQSDQVILATAFGQIKITGQVDEELLELAFKSLNRMERLYRLIFNYKNEDTPYNIKIMRRDLLKFKNECNESNVIKIKNNADNIIQDFIDLTGYEVEVIENARNSKWIADRYLELLNEFKSGGKFPVVVSVDNLLIEKFELDIEDEDWEINNVNFNKLVKKHLDDYKSIDIKNIFSKKTKDEIISEIQIKKLEKVGDSYDLELMSIYDIDDRLKNNLVIVKLDIKKPYEVFAYLPMGGFNDCPLPSEMVAVSKYWYEKYGAVPSALSYDECEYYVEKRFTDENIIKDLTAEHLLYNTDIVEQVVGSLEDLALCFYDNNQWYFWWD